MKHRIDAHDQRVLAYRELMAEATAGESFRCPHGLPAGHVVRPWCGTPGCPMCRRGPRMLWASVERARHVAAQP